MDDGGGGGSAGGGCCCCCPWLLYRSLLICMENLQGLVTGCSTSTSSDGTEKWSDGWPEKRDVPPDNHSRVERPDSIQWYSILSISVLYTH